LAKGGRLNWLLVLLMWVMSWARCRTKKLRRRSRSRLPFGARVDVGERKHAAAEHVGELAGVDLVAFGFALVDVLHGQGVPEDEGDALNFAEVGEPVPGEHALAADDEVFAEGLDGVEEGVGLGGQIAFEDGLALVREDVHEHGSGMQIDAGVELVWLVVVRHGSPPCVVTGRPDPASWLPALR